MSRHVLPWGDWPGTVSVEALAGQKRLTGFAVTPDGARLAWSEHDPGDDSTRLRVADRDLTDVWSPDGVAPRCRMHGYGGRAIWPGTGAYPWIFIQDEDQGVWALTSQGKSVPLHTVSGCRHADCDVHPPTGRLVFLQEAPGEDLTRLVLLDLQSGEAVQPFVEPVPFSASPRFSPDGRWVAWISWAANEMPWTRSRLWCLDVESGTCEALTDGQSSVIEPRWGADGSLYYLDDRAGWWQLYRLAGRSGRRVVDTAADIGRPPWQLAHGHHVGIADDITVAVQVDSARCAAVSIHPSGVVRDMGVAEVDITQLQAGGDDVWYLGSRENTPPAICRLDMASGQVERIVCLETSPDPDSVSRPEKMVAQGAQGAVHGYLYRPHCPGVSGPEAGRPPLLLRAHGGPTAMRSPAWNPEVQFWTGHGVAVLEVNYGGSSGHGRHYRERLRGNWGITDRDDCICMADAVAAEGLCDPGQMFIAGNSAGGLTVLNALRQTGRFRGGLCRWAVTDLARLATLTHRFERGYLDFLVGDPVAHASLYAHRSPALNADEITTPVLLVQGDADQIVPVSQATAMADAMIANGGHAELHVYPGEGHGLRNAANVRSAASSELAFVRGMLRR